MKLLNYQTELTEKNDIVTIEKYLKQFLNGYNSEHSKRRYESCLRKFFQFLLVNYPEINNANQIDYDVFDSYKTFLTQNDTASSTISNSFAIIRKFFDHLLGRGVIVRNECNQIKAQFQKNDEASAALNIDEVKTIKNAAKGKSAASVVDELILLLGFNLGLRREEIAKLKLSHLEQIKGGYSVKITGKGNKKRIVGLNDKQSAELFALIEKFEGFSGRTITKNDYIIQSVSFNTTAKNKKPMDASNIYRRFVKLAQKVGIDGVSPHSMRATLATTMYNNGVGVERIQRFLGHTDIKTTQGYIKTNNDAKNAIEIAVGY